MKCENCLKETTELYDLPVDGEHHEVCLECYQSSRGVQFNSKTKLKEKQNGRTK